MWDYATQSGIRSRKGVSRVNEGFFRDSFEEISVGDTTETIGRTLTESDVVNYANVTGCWFPVHTDKEFAASTMFGDRIVQGTFLVGLAEGLLFQNRETSIRANAGIGEISFHQPVYIDDTVRYTAEIIEKTPRDDDHGIVTAAIRCQNQHGEIVVEFENQYLVARAQQEDPTHD